MDGSQPEEALVHQRFAPQRCDREWFLETPALAEFIKANCRDAAIDFGGVSMSPGSGRMGRQWLARATTERRD